MMTLYARYTTQVVKPLPALQAAWLFEKSSSWNVGVTDKKNRSNLAAHDATFFGFESVRTLQKLRKLSARPATMFDSPKFELLACLINNDALAG